MYYAYFLNIETGELMRTGKPSDNPKGKEWKQITDEQWHDFLLVLQFDRYQRDDYK
jgi:hypothetical protein